MAQTKNKRKRKHRGTQAGTIEARGRTGRTATRADAAKVSRQQRSRERLSKPPTWQGATQRAAVTAVIFGVALALLFKRPPEAAAILTLFMFVLYIPLGYYTDLFIYRRRQARKKK